MKKICEFCGKEFVSKGNNAKYCNVKCRQIVYNKKSKAYRKKLKEKGLDRYGRPLEVKQCKICNKEFVSSNPRNRTCDISCRNIHRRHYRRKWVANNKQKNSVYKKRYKDKTKHLRNKYDDINKQNRQCVVCKKEYVGHFQSKTCGKKCNLIHKSNRYKIIYKSTPKNVMSVKRINNRIRKRLRTVLKRFNIRKTCLTFDLLGYTKEQLKEHIESLFTDGMSWERFDEIHIDHIRPIASFNYTTTECEDFKKCWALENLQPMWASDNMSKGSLWKGKRWRVKT